jgi:two-component system, OmpR family, phosphate regulon sensor histidine kinase PhoR
VSANPAQTCRYCGRVIQSGTSHETPLSSDELDRIRRRVLAVIGHELRTPVTILRGLAEQLDQASLDEIRSELGPALQRNAHRVEVLLDDLLLASEIVTALPVGVPAPVDIVSATRAAWDELGAPGELRLEGAPRAEALTRPGAAERILHHLLDNAAKYGDRPVTVYVHQGPQHVRVDVHSPGEDITDDDLTLAFELCYRGERAVTTAPGIGLGLPAARVLARQDGGDLELTRRARGGVVAHLTLRSV